MPEVPVEIPITSVLGQPRPRMSQHTFLGANAFMLRILNRYRGELGVTALPQELDAAIVKHYEYSTTSGELDRRNRDRVRIRIETQLKERFMEQLIGGTIAREEYEQLLEDVLRKRTNPYDAAEGVLARVKF